MCEACIILTRPAALPPQVWEVVEVWASYGLPSGQAGACRPPSDLQRVLPLVRFPLMAPSVLREVATGALAQQHPQLQVGPCMQRE